MAAEQRPRSEPMSERLLALVELSRQARTMTRTEELDYLIVNATHRLAPYRQAILWQGRNQPKALSGLIAPDGNAPMMRWLAHFYRDDLAKRPSGAINLEALSADDQSAWQAYLPTFGLWLPDPNDSEAQSGLLLVREMAWSEHEVNVIGEWWQTWVHARKALHAERTRQRRLNWQSIKAWLLPEGVPWRKKRLTWIVAGLLGLLLVPVRMTVIAPGQLVPVDPLWVRSPIEGVIAEVVVAPAEQVKAGDPLFHFDSEVLSSRVEVARRSLSTATARYEQLSQQALGDERYGAELIEAAGAVEEQRSELAFLRSRLQDSTVRAERGGIAIFDSASALMGQPVDVGERLMRIVQPGKSEIEAWLTVADAVDLPAGSPVNLYLRSSPLSPVSGEVRYVAYDATERPDGTVAYRVRASIDSGNDQRVGLKGTSRLSGSWTVLGYWLLRRPIASVRTRLGV